MSGSRSSTAARRFTVKRLCRILVTDRSNYSCDQGAGPPDAREREERELAD